MSNLSSFGSRERDRDTGSDIGVIALSEDEETEEERVSAMSASFQTGLTHRDQEEVNYEQGEEQRERREPRRVPKPAPTPRRGSRPGGADPRTAEDRERSSGNWKIFKIVLVLSLFSFGLGESYYFFYLTSGDRCEITTQESVSRWHKLQTEVRDTVFGQHIAIEGTLRAIYAHITDPNPKKALVLCFNGWLGSGKTYLSHLVAKHLFDGGLKSPHVVSFIGPRHFLLDPNKLHENQERLVKTIESTVKSCERSLFVFDEVDKMPAAIFNVLVPFIGQQGPIDGVDYGRATFIFLSNTGGARINNLTLEYLTAGKERMQLSLYDFREVVADGAFQEEAPPDSFFTPPQAVQEYLNTFSVYFTEMQQYGGIEYLKNRIVNSGAWESLKNSLPAQFSSSITKKEKVGGGLFQSEMITRRLVDFYIPFLPLEKKHVVLCAKLELKRRNVLYIDPMKIANRVLYFPLDNQIFAEEGCKNIMSHVAYHVHDSEDIFKDEF